MKTGNVFATFKLQARCCVVAAVSTICLAIACNPAAAQIHWINTSGIDNEFLNLNNWAEGVGPTAQNCIFDQAETYPVAFPDGFPAGITISRFDVFNGDVTFAGDFELTVTSSVRSNVDFGAKLTLVGVDIRFENVGVDGMHVGNEQSGQLVMSDSHISNGYFAIIGRLKGSSGTVEMYDGSILSATSLNVGDGGAGSMLIAGGSSAAAASIYVGAAPGIVGEIIVDGNGSRLFSNNNPVLGVNGGHGLLHVRNGATAAASRFRLGIDQNSGGTVIVDGVNSLVQGSIEGSFGTSEVMITAGGTFDGQLGINGGPVPDSMTIDGTGSLWTTPIAKLNGVLVDIAAGGELNAGSTSLSLLNQFTMVTVSGDGSIWNNGPYNLLRIGFLGTAAVFVENGGNINFAGPVEVYELAIVENNGGHLFVEELTIFPLSTVVSNGATFVHTLVIDGALEIAAGTSVVCDRFVDSSRGTSGAGTLEISELLNPITTSGTIEFESCLKLGPESVMLLEADFIQSSIDRLIVQGDLDIHGRLQLDVAFPFGLQDGVSFPIVDITGQRSGQFKGLREGAQVFRNSKTGLFITYTAGDGNDIALVAGPAEVPQFVLPPIHAESEGGWLEVTALAASVERTVQVVYDQVLMDEAGMFPGARITGLAYRVDANSNIPPSWNVDDYQIRMATSLNPAGNLDPTFELNRGLDYTVVRLGPLQLAGYEYTVGQAPNHFGFPIVFDVPFTWNGGPLLLEYTHTFAPGAGQADGAIVPGVQTQYSPGYDTGMEGFNGLGMNRAPVVQFEILVEGDVNCDGRLDLLDVAPFVEAISSATYNFRADINNDGKVDLQDIAPFIDLLT